MDQAPYTEVVVECTVVLGCSPRAWDLNLFPIKKLLKTEGFKIDTMRTYHGLSLKSVTEGSQSHKMAPQPDLAPQNKFYTTLLIRVEGVVPVTSCEGD
ncbi:Parafibromin [Portunus trituberculatus]|uniref:Parafibromin n=1 Tax=Portunus trituberculatus TaxID=210409 RepID=A0A5B7DHW9_PORTR|nr:Parafibromin [Portunus trituberculatus]